MAFFLGRDTHAASKGVDRRKVIVYSDMCPHIGSCISGLTVGFPVLSHIPERSHVRAVSP